MANPPYKWRHARLWLCLILYWLVSMIGAGILARVGVARAETSWIVLTMLALVIVCMISERGRWKTWQRVLFVPLAWIAQPLLYIPLALPLALMIAVLDFGGGRKDLVDRSIVFLSSLPVVLFAMRQSRLFVSAQAGGSESRTEHGA